MLDPKAQAIAEAQADRDRATLARLVREGKVIRRLDKLDPEFERLMRADLVAAGVLKPKPPVNPTIRPKSKARRRKR